MEKYGIQEIQFEPLFKYNYISDYFYNIIYPI